MLEEVKYPPTHLAVIEKKPVYTVIVREGPLTNGGHVYLIAQESGSHVYFIAQESGFTWYCFRMAKDTNSV